MNVKRPLRWFAITLLILLTLLLAAVAMALSHSTLELTAHGVHQRLYVPLGKGEAKISMFAGTGDSVSLPAFLDGPIVRPDGGGWSATWFCEDRVVRQQVSAPQLEINCAGQRTAYPIGAPAAKPAADVLPMPAKVAVLSDIEGNLHFLDGALQRLSVTDSSGTWNYGDGHLVVVGDAVDRGREVFGVLWRLYALSLQAQRAGGAVHLVLGNHEQYLLRGNTTRANLDHLFALDQMGGQQQAFAADTVIGQWLRVQPVILQMGGVLFTHGGISRQTVDSSLSVQRLNEAMRTYWRGGASIPTPALDAILGKHGVTQYRGYLDAESGLATAADIEHALRRFDASIIVVGHTLVEKVSVLHGGRVIAVDVNTNEAADEALVFENGMPRVVAVVNRALGPEESPPGRKRRLVLTDARDWQALGSTVQRSYELSRLPHPY